MGLTALRKNRAILDFNTLTLYFCGEEGYDLNEVLPAETGRYKLEKAPSGHLVLPCCEYKAGTTNQEYSMTLMAKTALPSTIVEKKPADKKAKKGNEDDMCPPPPDYSPSLMQEQDVMTPPPPSTQPVGTQGRRGRTRTCIAHEKRN